MAIAAADQCGSEDVLTEILSRLPVKTLIRFRSVCKLWYSLIQTSNFTTLHHNHANTYLLANRSSYIGSINDPINVISFVHEDHNQTLVEEDTHPFSMGLHYDLQLVSPSINGLVCFLIHYISLTLPKPEPQPDSNLVLYNPSMREFRILPKPPYQSRRTSHLGFGFDPKTNDYKVVRVATLYESDVNPPPVDEYGYCEDEGAEMRSVDEKVHLYEMGTDSWREIDTPVPRNFMCDALGAGCACTTANGDLYWYATRFTNDLRITEKTIIVFRVREEVFEHLPEPLPEHTYASRPVLYVVNNSLALVLSTTDFSVKPPVHSFDVWILNECGWIKAYTTPQLIGCYVALALCQDYVFLMKYNNNDQMVSCDLVTQEIKEYQLYCTPAYPSLQVVEYTESLVSVKRRNHY